MRVLAAVDSFGSEAVVRAARALAGAAAAELVVLHVCGWDSDDLVPASATAAAQAVGATVTVEHGDAAAVICRYAAAPDVAAVVLATRTWPPDRPTLGAVTTEVVRRVESPVMVVPPTHPPAWTFRRVLVPLDARTVFGGEVAQQARRLVGADVSYVPLHVLGRASGLRFVDHPGHDIVESCWSDDFVARFAPDLTGPLVLVSAVDPAASILATSREAFDLIVVVSSRTPGTDHGPVVSRVLAEAPVPVLLLRAQPADVTTRPEAAIDLTCPSPAPSGGILLVEDDPGDARLTARALQDAHLLAELHVVSSGEDALAYLRRDPPHQDAELPRLVLLDLNLPGIDGRQVLRAMKGDACLRRVPVAVLTSSMADADVDLAYELGATCFVTKPVNYHEFVEAIRTLATFWFTAVRSPGAASAVG